MGYIYRIKNIVTGKYYIGESKDKNIQSRWNTHIRLVNQNKGCPALRDAVKKYGWDKFKFEIICICFDSDRYIYERHYIQKYNSQVPNGYNITKGGEGGGFEGKTHSESTRKRLSEASTKYYSDPEKRKENSVRVKEAMKSVNIRERMQKSEKWKKAVEKMKQGKKVSEETKQKIRESVTKYFQGDDLNKNNIKNHRKIMAKARGKKVSQYTLEGEFIATYESMKEAERQTGCNDDCIRNVIKGKTQTAKGFKWKLAEE